MYTRVILRYFKFHLRLCTLIGSISFQWDNKKGRLTPLKSKPRLFQFYLHILIAVVHNIFLIVNLIMQDLSSFGIAYKMLAIYFTIGYVMCNGCRVVIWLFEHEVMKLINAQLDFEKSIRVLKMTEVEQTAGGEKREKILLILGLITGIFVPILVFLIIMAHPCLPPFVGSILFVYKNNHCTTFSWSVYFAISLMNFWMHLDMVLPMAFSMFGIFFMSIACLQDYLEVVRRDFSIEKGSNWSGNGKVGPVPVRVAMIPMLLFRQLQLFEIQVNICFKRYYFPLFLSGMTALLIFCMHSCIKLPGKIPMPGFSYFPIVVVDGIVSLLVMNTNAANVREVSMDIIQKWKNSPKLPRKHWVKKMALSFQSFKVEFGSNFVEKLTPLVMINFSVNQVVSLLLIQS